MKKYKVVTDNLDWYGIKIESILHEHVDNFYCFLPGSVAGHAVRSQYDIYAAIAAHPEWFSEIKEEEPKEFTREDMCRFASYAHCYHSKKLSYDALLSEWESYYHHK